MKPSTTSVKSITKNTFYNAVGKLVHIIISLALTPYIIYNIGIERFGIWAIVGMVTGYFGLLDVGIANSYVKFISDAYSVKNFKKVNQVVNTGIIFYLFLGVFLTTIAYPFLGTLIDFLNISKPLFEEAYFVIFFGIILFFISNVLNVFNSIIVSAQRMEVSNAISIMAAIINALGTVFFLEMGYGLKGLILNNCMVFSICTILNSKNAFKIIPELEIKPSFFNVFTLKEMIKFGMTLQVSNFADILTLQTDKLLVSYFFNTSFVGYYQLGGSIVKRIRELPGLMFSAILPAACDLNSKGDNGKLLELYIKGSKILSLATIPLFLFSIVSADFIMLSWMGKGYEMSALVIKILSLGYLMNILSGVGSVISQAISKPQIQMKAAIITSSLNIVLSIIFASIFGFYGICLATSVAFLVSFVYFYSSVNNELSVNSKKFCLDVYMTPFIISIPLSFILYMVNSRLVDIPYFNNRILSITVLTLELILYTLAYSYAIIKSGYIKDIIQKIIHIIPPRLASLFRVA